MRLRRKQDAAPRPASGYNVLRQVRRVHLRAGRDMVKAEHLRRTVDGLQQRLSRSTATRPSFRGVSSPCQMPSSTASSPPQPSLPEAQLLRASLLATLCLLYLSGFR
eukprot:6176235-Pleurochrysis_carterae.AAC.1